MSTVLPESGAVISFPALCVSQDLLTVIGSLDSITECTKLGFKTGFYKRLALVDAGGHKFQVTAARKVRRLPFRFRFGDFLALIDGNPRWKIELAFVSNPVKMSEEQIKELILDCFKKKQDHWEEMCDLEELRGKIQAAASLDQIFDAFKEFNVL